MDNYFPRVLVIGNECLSNVSSNGRTMRNFLLGYPKEKLAQFCIRNASPDFEICERYYYVSDSAALNSFLRGKLADGNLPRNVSGTDTSTVKPKQRNAVTMMIRNFVWNSMRWAGKDFYKWVEDFSPEIILLQAGDCAFMLKLARKLALKYNIPLVIYNSEAYYFKKFDYFRSHGLAQLLYPVFHRNFCREFDKTVKLAKKSVYCCDKLKDDYDACFHLPSEVIYTATQVTPKKYKTPHDNLKISYLGNLGVGRHEGLIEIAEVLQSISPDLKLDVYGKIPSEDIKNAFDSCHGIRYMGFISYEDVVEIMQSSDILVHTENFSDFYKEDLKYAFSTKIADSLASGTCFLLYAPECMACSEYLRKNKAAYVVGNHQELIHTLVELCSDINAREKYIAQAHLITNYNHSAKHNAIRFQELLRQMDKV